MLRNHPMAWIVEVDGIVFDARSLPEDQLLALRRLGIVPDVEPRPGSSSGE